MRMFGLSVQHRIPPVLLLWYAWRGETQFGGFSRTGQRRFLPSTSATRAFTIFFSRAAGRGLSTGKWMVPFDTWKSSSSSLNFAITDAVGNRLQWSENAAYHMSVPLYLNPGMP